MTATVKHSKGFTLIELSIVLVIIGLVVGGILVGRDLIKAAEVNAQIAQITKYSSAVNAFRNKYGGLPGDLQSTLAAQFGFLARTGGPGQGNGDGLITSTTNGWGFAMGYGEGAVFWNDLGAAGLIDGSFSTANFTGGQPDATPTNGFISLYMPTARIGNGSYVYVWSVDQSVAPVASGPNYFGISAVTLLANTSAFGKMWSSPGMSVLQAYNIDKKIDDGLPTTGQVVAAWVDLGAGWSQQPVISTPFPTIPSSVIAQTSTTCFDNGSNSAATIQYSLGATANGGSGLNCGLSFLFP